MVRSSLHQSVLDLSDLCSLTAEYAGVIVRLGTQDTTIVSIYVAPGGTWDPDVLHQIQQRAKGELLLAGDFNAHNINWVIAEPTEGEDAWKIPLRP